MTRGEQLRSDLAVQRSFGPADAALVEEACRIADRLDRLDAMLVGASDEWMRVEFRTGKDARLVVDDVLGEARQQANALRQIFATLKLVGVEVEEPKADGVDELGAKRSARRARAQVQDGSSGG